VLIDVDWLLVQIAGDFRGECFQLLVKNFSPELFGAAANSVVSW